MMRDKYHNPQSFIAVLAALLFFIPIFVYISLHHYNSFWPACVWLILPIALPPLFILILGPFLFPAAVITITQQFNGGDFLLIEGKKCYLSSNTPQVKIFFWRPGEHEIFLVNMENETPIISSSLKVNTYGHHIVYKEFPQNQPQSGGGNPPVTP